MLGILAASVALASPVRADGKSEVAVEPSARHDRVLARARSAMQEELDVDRARALAGRALRSGALSPAQVAEAHQILGETASAVGAGEEAVRQFRKVLALRPGARLAPGTSPKILRHFEAALERTRTEGALEVAARVEDDQLIVELTDPVFMTAKVRIEAGTGDPLEREPRARLTLPVPAPRPSQVTIALSDEYGNVLSRTELSLVEAPMASAQLDVEPARRSLWARWYPYAIASVAAAGGGVYFGLRARDAEDELDGYRDEPGSGTYPQFQDAEKRAERSALAANVLWGTAAAFAVTSVVVGLVFADPAPPERSAERSSVAVRPSSGGVHVDLVVRF